MPRQQRKQHQNQRPNRRKQYQVGGAGGEKYKPGFPMNIFQKTNWFWGVGLVAMIGGLIVGAFAFAATQDVNPVFDDQTPTSTIAATGTVSGTATPARQQFPAAEQVLVPTSTYTGTISTSKGDIEIEFFADVAPNTVNSFLFLAREGFFNGQIVHRVDDGFVIQSGDPDGINGNGFDGPGYSTNDEPNQIRNERGTLSMAKVGGQTSFGSQWFINLDDNPTLDYDNGAGDSFYPFARVTSGMDVVDSIEVGDIIEAVTFVERPDPNAPTPTATDAPETETPASSEETATPTP
ncbi:MAG: peptidylprolyl isomerase [Dehalococcoidia bacterium]